MPTLSPVPLPVVPTGPSPPSPAPRVRPLSAEQKRAQQPELGATWSVAALAPALPLPFPVDPDLPPSPKHRYRSQYQAPDPAVLMSTEGGLSSLLTAAEDVQAGEDVRDGQEVLSTFTGTVPGKAVARVIPSAEADADFDATFTLDDDNQLSRVVMSGPFYPGTDPVTYTIALDRYGTDKDIQAP